MNEKVQSAIIAFLAVCLVLIGITVYAQNKQLVSQGVKIDHLIDTVTGQPEQMIPTNQQSAPVTQTPSTTSEFATTTDDVGSDAGATIVYGDFAAWLPLDWEARATAANRWEITNDRNQTVAVASCPSPETGYEAWDFTTVNRSYTHNGKTLYAGKWIGKPSLGSENLGWLALVWGGSPDKITWGGSGCQIMFDVSSPPTRDQLGRIETIYQMIR